MKSAELFVRETRGGLSEALSTGRALVAAGVITQQQLDICLRQQAVFADMGQQLFIEQVLVRNDFASKDQIAAVLGQDAGGAKSGSILPMQICRQYDVYPLRIVNGVLEMKSARPLNERQLATIKAACSTPVVSIDILPTDLVDLTATLARVMGGEQSFELVLEKMKHEAISGVMLRQAIHALLSESIDLRASDIHLDRKADPDAWASHRVDGRVIQSHLVLARLMAAIFTKIKTDAGMDASDSRRPQDGRISIDRHGRTVNFRVATNPIVGGETMTLRVLDPDALLSLDQLFPSQPDMTALFTRLSKVEGKSGGLVLFTGPTGSGKTTSLYALAKKFQRDVSNLITVEDPVEYELTFIRQIQLNQLLNERSTDLERSLLRQDPDVIIIGEIRDADTMRAALKFTESGHLVLASLHAKNPEKAIERVLQFVGAGQKNETLFLLTSALRMIVSQRLIKKLCACAVEGDNQEQILAEAKANHFTVRPSMPGMRFMRARGCPQCGNTGYFGRVAAHETLVISENEALRSKITQLMYETTSNFSIVTGLEGVTFKRRADSLSRLMEAGVIDYPTASHTFSQELIEEPTVAERTDV